MSTHPKVWLITGALSGFGRIMTELVLANGDNCVATSINPTTLNDLVEKYGPSRLLNLHVDVTKPEEIAAAFAEGYKVFGGIDFVLNNAGLGLSGIVEVVPETTARKLMDVNFWGSTSVSKEAVRFFREVNGPKRGGKLLVMSSAAGFGASALMGYYAASKHAIEGITTSISREINPEWNIQITLVEPGWMATAILAGSPEFSVPVPEVYGGDAFVQRVRKTIKAPGDPKAAMELLHSVAQREKLPFHLPIGSISIMSAKHAAATWTKVVEEWEEEACREVYGVAHPLV